MARPGLESNPAFREMLNRALPVKSAVDEAKAQCEAIMRAAKARVENDRLAIVRFGLENGLSKYAVCKVWGITAGPDQDRLIAQAMGADWLPESKNPNGVPFIVFEHDGWRAVFMKTWEWGANGYITCDWEVTHDGEPFMFHNNEAQWWCTPTSAMEFIHDGSMPDEIFRPLCDFKPDNG